MLFYQLQNYNTLIWIVISAQLQYVQKYITLISIVISAQLRYIQNYNTLMSIVISAQLRYMQNYNTLLWIVISSQLHYMELLIFSAARLCSANDWKVLTRVYSMIRILILNFTGSNFLKRKEKILIISQLIWIFKNIFRVKYIWKYFLYIDLLIHRNNYNLSFFTRLYLQLLIS